MNWRFMLGYEISQGEIVIDPDGAEVVKEVFRRFLGGESLNAIAKDLNRREIRSTFGGAWTPIRIRRMLSNEKYTGNALLWKHFRNNHIEKKITENKGQLPRFYVEESHPAIIDEATFAKAQERLKEIQQMVADRAPPTRSVFTGIIRCGCCGRTYLRIKNHQYHAWKCTTKKVHGDGACHSAQIREDILQAAAAQSLGIDLFDERAFQSKIAGITATQDRTLVFHFNDGTDSEVRWQPASRSQSWTPEMRAAAAERTRQKRRKK